MPDNEQRPPGTRLVAEAIADAKDHFQVTEKLTSLLEDMNKLAQDADIAKQNAFASLHYVIRAAHSGQVALSTAQLSQLEPLAKIYGQEGSLALLDEVRTTLNAA